MLEVNAQLLLRLAKILFRAFAVGNITANTEQSDDVAVGLAMRPRRRKIGPRHTGGDSKLLVGLRPSGFDNIT